MQDIGTPGPTLPTPGLVIGITCGFLSDILILILTAPIHCRGPPLSKSCNS